MDLIMKEPKVLVYKDPLIFIGRHYRECRTERAVTLNAVIGIGK